MVDDPTGGLAPVVTRKCLKLLTTELAMARLREVCWDDDKKVYVVTWASEAQKDDEPWRRPGLASAGLDRRSCVLWVSRDSSSGRHCLKCIHPLCGVKGVPSSCHLAVAPGAMVPTDVAQHWMAARLRDGLVEPTEAFVGLDLSIVGRMDSSMVLFSHRPSPGVQPQARLTSQFGLTESATLASSHPDRPAELLDDGDHPVSDPEVETAAGKSRSGEVTSHGSPLKLDPSISARFAEVCGSKESAAQQINLLMARMVNREFGEEALPALTVPSTQAAAGVATSRSNSTRCNKVWG